MPSQNIGLKNALIQKFTDLLNRVRAKLLAISADVQRSFQVTNANINS